MLAWGKVRVGGIHKLVVIDPGVGRKVDDGVAEVVVEAVIERAVGHRLGPIEIGVFDGFLRTAGFADGIPVIGDALFGFDQAVGLVQRAFVARFGKFRLARLQSV